MRRHIITATALTVALVLAACGGPAGVGDAPEDLRTDLVGSWQLAEGHGPEGSVPLVDDHPITLVFAADDDTLGGTAACNSYGGEFELVGDRLTISMLLATEMACMNDGVMESEQAYLATLPKVETVSVDGDRLVLAGDDVELRFERLPEPEDRALVGTVWVLDTLIEGEAASSVPDAPDPVTVEFAEDGTFRASTGCNTVDGEVVERSGRLDLTPVAVTDVACPDLERLEDHVLAVLDGEAAFEIEGGRLTLTGADGRGLSYRAE
jgi:heat shock protein HslJ